MRWRCGWGVDQCWAEFDACRSMSFRRCSGVLLEGCSQGLQETPRVWCRRLVTTALSCVDVPFRSLTGTRVLVRSSTGELIPAIPSRFGRARPRTDLAELGQGGSATTESTRQVPPPSPSTPTPREDPFKCTMFTTPPLAALRARPRPRHNSGRRKGRRACTARGSRRGRPRARTPAEERRAARLSSPFFCIHECISLCIYLVLQPSLHQCSSCCLIITHCRRLFCSRTSGPQSHAAVLQVAGYFWSGRATTTKQAWRALLKAQKAESMKTAAWTRLGPQTAS